MTQNPRPTLSARGACIACLAFVAAADAKMSKAEYALIATILEGETESDIAITLDLLAAEGGVDALFEMVALALIEENTISPLTKAAKAYTLCAEFVVRNGKHTPEEIRALELLGEQLRIDRLTRAAIDTAMRIRFLSTDL